MGRIFGEEGFGALLVFAADDVDIDGEALWFGEVKEEGGAAFEGEVEGGGGESVEEGEGEDCFFEDEGVGSAKGFAAGGDPSEGVGIGRDHEVMPPSLRRWGGIDFAAFGVAGEGGNIEAVFGGDVLEEAFVFGLVEEGELFVFVVEIDEGLLDGGEFFGVV